MAQEKDARHIVTHGPDISSWWRCVGAGGATVVGARGDCLRQGSAEFREPLLGFVVAWWKRAGRAQLRNESCGPGSLLDVDCWTKTAC